MTGQRHTELMDAAGFWKQFPVSVSWDTPKEIKGTIVELTSHKNPAGEYSPKLRVLDETSGQVYVVIASQARLLELLVEACPAKSDRIRIRYLGESDRAAFGLNKTKEFTVEVRRAGSQPRGKDDGTSGEKAVVDGASGAGK